MRRGYALLVTLGLLTPLTASAGTSLGVSLTIGDAPPPPVVVVREQPHIVVVPSTSVYVVDDRHYDYDCFRYGVYWYVYNDGWWYRARSYRGPFRAIEVRYVPRAIMSVPARHWKRHPHGGPPGLTKRHRGHDHDVVVVKDKGRGKSKGHR